MIDTRWIGLFYRKTSSAQRLVWNNLYELKMYELGSPFCLTYGICYELVFDEATAPLCSGGAAGPRVPSVIGLGGGTGVSVVADIAILYSSSNFGHP